MVAGSGRGLSQRQAVRRQADRPPAGTQENRPTSIGHPPISCRRAPADCRGRVGPRL